MASRRPLVRIEGDTRTLPEGDTLPVQIIEGAVATDDPRLSNSREWTAETVSQAEAEAGTATTRRAWTAQRVRQAIVAWWNGSADKTKLDGIAAGATANQSDAYLLNRANHTGTQAQSTITGLTTDLAAKADKTITLTAGTGLTGGGDLSANRSFAVAYGTTAGTAAQGNDARLSDSREWTAETISQAEAEAGTATTRRAFTAQRVRQAIVAWWNTIGTTVGKSLLSLTNPSAISFLRVNADNTVTARNATDFRADIGANSATNLTTGTLPAARFDDTAHGNRAGGALHALATGSAHGFFSSTDFTKLAGIAPGATANTGTVTSVGLSVPTGFSVADSPVTGAGTLTLTFAAGYQGYTTAEATKLAGIADNANNYTLPAATATALGGIELFSNTVQAVAANAVSATAARTYGVQLNADGQAVVNVPWADTNTTYSGSTSITLSGTSFQRAALTGDVTASANSNATTIANNAVSNAKLADMAASTIKGRVTASTGDPEDLTAAQARALLNVADGATTNQSDSFLLNRANHTGTQAQSTITGLTTDLAAKADKTITLTAGTGLTGGGDLSANRSFAVAYGTTAGTAAEGNDSRLSNSREWTASTVTQAEAEAGTATDRRAWTAQRVRQAIAAWWAGIGTTVGNALLNLANPGAVRFIRINADNTVTARSDSEMRTDLGLGTAATADVVTSASDITAGRVLTVAYSGLGAALAENDFSTITAGGISRNKLFRTPFQPSDRPVGAVNYLSGIIFGHHVADYETVIAAGAANSEQGGALHFRNKTGTWQSWRRVLDSDQLTQSTTDTTVGRVLKVGDYGMGVAAQFVSGQQYNNLTVPGDYACSPTTTGNNAPIASTPFLVNVSAGQASALNDRITQQAVTYGVTPSRYFRRGFNGTAWTPWDEIYHSGSVIPVANGGTGATDAATARTNLGAASTAVATTSANGLMSAADKTKVDGLGADGTAAAPSYSFINDPDTGFYRSAANVMGLSAGGNEIVSFSATAVTSNKGIVLPALTDAAMGSIGQSAVRITNRPSDDRGTWLFQMDNTVGGFKSGIQIRHDTGFIRFYVSGTANYVDIRQGNISVDGQTVLHTGNATGAASPILFGNLTADRALVSSSSGKVAASAVTATQMGYLANATSQVSYQVAVPATPTSSGVAGTWAADATHLYHCYAANTWRRVAHSTW